MIFFSVVAGVENIVGKGENADNDKIDLPYQLIFVLAEIENIVGKGENADNQHFLFFPQCFQKDSFSGSLKLGTVW